MMPEVSPGAYVIGPNRGAAAHTLLFSLLPLFTVGRAVARLANGQPTLWWPWLVSLPLMLLLWYFGLRTLLRKKPVLVADGRGVWANLWGSYESFVPWEDVAGVETVGKRGSKPAFLVLTGVGEPGPGVRLDKFGAALRAENNKRHKLNGLLWLPYRLGADPPEVVERLRAMALAYHERAGSGEAERAVAAAG